MAFTEQVYTIKGEQFRILHNTDLKEIWVQQLPKYSVIGVISTDTLHIPAGQQGHEDMADYIIRFKAWINGIIATYFSSATPVPTPPATPTPTPIVTQIDDLVVNLTIVGDKFV